MKIEPAKPSVPSEVSKVGTPKHAMAANFHGVLCGLIGPPSQGQAVHGLASFMGEKPEPFLDKPHSEPCETPTRPLVSIPIVPLPAVLTHTLPPPPPLPVADALQPQSPTVSAALPESFANPHLAEQAVTATPAKESPVSFADIRPSTSVHTSAPAYTGAMPSPPPVPPVPPPIAEASPIHASTVTGITTAAGESPVNRADMRPSTPAHTSVMPSPLRPEGEATQPVAGTSPRHNPTVSASRPESFVNPREAEQTAITIAAKESPVNRADMRPSTPVYTNPSAHTSGAPAHTGAPTYTGAKPSSLHTESEAMPPVAGTSPRQSSTVSASRPESFANPREAEQTAITIAAKESPVNHAYLRPGTPAYTSAPAYTVATPSSLRSEGEVSPLLQLHETTPAPVRGTMPAPPPVSAASLQALRMEIVSFVQNPSRPQVTVEIHPPEYGRVLVSGEMDPQGGVAVRLVVENSAVKEHLVLHLQRFPTPAEVEVMTREEYREHGESSGQRRREEGSRQPPRRHDKHTTEFSV